MTQADIAQKQYIHHQMLQKQQPRFCALVAKDMPTTRRPGKREFSWLKDNYPVDYRTILDEEIVFEIDANWPQTVELSERILNTLDSMNIEYWKSYSGGKSAYNHTFFDLKSVVKFGAVKEALDMGLELQEIKMFLWHWILDKVGIIRDHCFGNFKDCDICKHCIVNDRCKAKDDTYQKMRGNIIDDSVVKAKPVRVEGNLEVTSSGFLIRTFGAFHPRYYNAKTIVDSFPDKKPAECSIKPLDAVFPDKLPAKFPVPADEFMVFCVEWVKKKKEELAREEKYKNSTVVSKSSYTEKPCIKYLIEHGARSGNNFCARTAIMIAGILDNLPDEHIKHRLKTFLIASSKNHNRRRDFEAAAANIPLLRRTSLHFSCKKLQYARMCRVENPSECFSSIQEITSKEFLVGGCPVILDLPDGDYCFQCCSYDCIHVQIAREHVKEASD